MNRSAFSGLLAAALLAGPVAAQEPLTLARTLEIARVRSPLVTAAAGARALASGRAREASTLPNPVAQYRRENDGSPLQPDVFAEVALPFDLTGRRMALRGAARIGRERGLADSVTLTRQAGYEAAAAWWRAAQAQELAVAAEAQREALAGIAASDSTRFAEGAVSELVAIRTRLEADRARIAAATAFSTLARARADLARVIGLPVDSLPSIARPDLTAAPLAPPPIDSALAIASRERPDLRSARLAAEETDRRLTAERRGILGADAQLVGGYKRTIGFNTALVGVLVPLPLFNANGGARERALGEALLARAALREAEARARGDVLSAIQGWNALRAAVPGDGAALATAGDDVAAITEAAYREGAVSLLELLESQRARADARAAAIRWRTDAALLRIDLDRALGAPVSELP
jgi:cobalt-zinc-cadmium efflux system outer membrane protein